jgi:predicted O-linked N-acetylglucosamine transferase (SPINDLY family)/SAM-dependent methyltransferase
MNFYQQNRAYFQWQRGMGQFSAKVDSFKFTEFIEPDAVVVDFGCSGGYLLKEIICREKLGVEANGYGRREAEKNGIRTVETVNEIPDNFADLVISHHVLEHVDNPVETLRELRKKLKPAGKIVFVVPHQDIRESFNPKDPNHHLYTWNQQTLGNLFRHAGFRIVAIDSIQHQWPPDYEDLYRRVGADEFHRRCRQFAKKNQNYQLRIVAEKERAVVGQGRMQAGDAYTTETPVILLTYNRPEHTRQVLQALKGFDRQNLYLFSDGPANHSAIEPVQETRKLLSAVDWCRPELIFRDENRGCASSVLSSIEHVLKKHDRFILLEDDCVPDRYFFDFTETCLTKYESDQRVYGICGYTVPVDDKLLKQYPHDLYFLPRIGCWGWATWANRWRQYEKDLLRAYQRAIRLKVDLDQCGNDIRLMLLSQLTGRLRDNWDLNWMLTVYLRKGAFVYPTLSHIKNIGMDGSGTHCGKTERYQTKLARRPPHRYPDKAYFDKSMIDNYRTYYDIPGLRKKDPAPATKGRHRRPPRIVHLCAQDCGGAGIAAHRLHRGLLEMGVDSMMVVLNKTTKDPGVKVISPDPTRPGRCRTQSDPYQSPLWEQATKRWQKMYRLYPNRPAYHELFTDIFSELRWEDVKEIQEADIIHLHWVAGMMDFPSAGRWLGGKKVVWTLHDMNPFTGGCHYAGDCRRYLKSCGRCPQLGSRDPDDYSRQFWQAKSDVYQRMGCHIVSPSEWLKGCAEQSSLFSGKAHSVIPNGLPPEVFFPKNKKEIRRRLGIPQGADVILFGADAVANIRKGFSYLLEALDKLEPAADKEIVLLTFGHMQNVDRVPAKFAYVNIGPLDDPNHLASVYSSADVFVIPSLEDNLPNTAVEALACGVPVVGFDVGGIRDIVEPSRTGRLAGAGDVSSLEEGIKWVLDAKSLGADFRTACRQKAMQRFSQKGQAATYAALYSNLMDASLIERADSAAGPCAASPGKPGPASFNDAIHRLKTELNDGHDPGHRPPELAAFILDRDRTENRTLAAAKDLRRRLFRQLMDTRPEDVEKCYLNGWRAPWQQVTTSSLKNYPLSAEEQQVVAQISSELNEARSGRERIKPTVAGMLYLHAFQMPQILEFETLPGWFCNDYFRYLFTAPLNFASPGDVDRYGRYIKKLIADLQQFIFKQPRSTVARRLARLFTQQSNLAGLYFSNHELKEIYSMRSQIVGFTLTQEGYSPDHDQIKCRPVQGKIRFGVYTRSILPCAETYATLPVYKFLDRAEFETHLFVHKSDHNPLEASCRQQADSFTVLPNDIKESVEFLRDQKLDVLFFGNNLTSNCHSGFLLAQHRIAPVQCIHFCNPVSPGLDHIDYFIVGDQINRNGRLSNSFAESIFSIEGSGICFDLNDADETLPPLSIDPIGSPNASTVYVSGANYYKLIPELMHTWAKILAADAGSTLMLYPFGPAWSFSYPKQLLLDQLHAVFKAYAVSPERLILFDTLPSREEILKILQMADIYLDALPYNGATSLLDPLKTGLPPVVVEGDQLRFCQGAAILKELDLEELIARDEAEYIRLALRLAGDRKWRDALITKINQRMNSVPPFLNPRRYSNQMAAAFKQMILERSPVSVSQTRTQ